MTDNLRTMVDRLMRPWPLKIDWAERIQDCTEACNTWKTYMTVAELRHYDDPCPYHIEYRQTYPEQVPVLTQLVEAKYEVPVTGNAERGGTKLEPPMPGNLVTPDTLMWNIRIAAGRIVADWNIVTTSGRQNGKTSGVVWLETITAVIAYRTPQELDDAAALLRPAYDAAMRYLGYTTDRVMLLDTSCDTCGGVLSAPRELGQGSMDVHCEGWNAEPPCGRTYSPAEWLAMHESSARTPNGTKTHCPQHHVYDEFNTRIGKDGKRRCRTCEHERRMLRSSKR